MEDTGQQMSLDTSHSTPDATSVRLGIDPSFLKEFSPKKEFRHLSCKLWTCVSLIPSDP